MSTITATHEGIRPLKGYALIRQEKTPHTAPSGVIVGYLDTTYQSIARVMAVADPNDQIKKGQLVVVNQYAGHVIDADTEVATRIIAIEDIAAVIEYGRH